MPGHLTQDTRPVLARIKLLATSVTSFLPSPPSPKLHTTTKEPAIHKGRAIASLDLN